MCGRIDAHDPIGVNNLISLLDIVIPKAKFPPRYNIAPGADILSVRVLDENGNKVRKTDKKGFRLVYFNAGDVSEHMDANGDIDDGVKSAMTDNGWTFAS